jgi:hypothetical protein
MKPYIGELIIAAVLAFFWVGAWAATSGRGLVKAFRLGPPILIPAMMAWAAISWELGSGESKDLWRQLPLHAAFGVAVLWHLLLIRTERERSFYVRYALVHLPLFWLFWQFAVIIALRFPL